MGKMRVNDLAKELNLQNKDLIEKLKNMGYSVKSHLSTLEDSEVDEIRKKINNKSKEKDDEKNNQAKKEKKPIAPVIIRREVTRVETEEDKKVSTGKSDRSDLGVVQRRTDTSMNIKYRTEPRKINPIATNKKEEVKVNTAINKNEQKTEIKSEIKAENKVNEVSQNVKENVKKVEEK